MQNIPWSFSRVSRGRLGAIVTRVFVCTVSAIVAFSFKKGSVDMSYVLSLNRLLRGNWGARFQRTRTRPLTAGVCTKERSLPSPHSGRLDPVTLSTGELCRVCARHRSLAAELDVEHLASRLTPLLLQNGQAAVLAVGEMAVSDQAAALLGLMQERGYVLADPSLYHVDEATLVAVQSERQDDSDALSAGRDRNELEQLFLRLLRWALEQGASDIHVRLRLDQAFSDVHFSVAGRHVRPDLFQALDTRLLMDMLALVWMDAQGGNGAVFDPQAEQQASVHKQVGERRVSLRWASMSALHGPAVCLRLLATPKDSALPELEELGYLPAQLQQFRRLMSSEGGAILFAGSVGSGKSTSLAALVRSVPATRKIITLEDPVEYLIPNAIQSSLSRRLDQDAHTVFASKLRALKRSAMQDVLLGEIRDRETGEAFMDLASSGVSVYSTVHAASVEQIPERLASGFIGVPREFLATPGMLKLLVFQALLPVLCAACSADSPPDQSAARSLACLEALAPGSFSGLRWRVAAGCAHCQRSRLPEQFGYQGRTIVAELLEPDLLPQSHERMRQGLVLRAATADLPGILSSALQLAGQGRLDLRDIEARFGAFDTWRMRRRAMLDGTASIPGCA